MADVHKAMDMLKVMEVRWVFLLPDQLNHAPNVLCRWHTAGRLWDMLYELAVVGDLPLPSSSHAAVIRSIKQNRRLSTKANKPVVEPEGRIFSMPPPSTLPRRSASVSMTPSGPRASGGTHRSNSTQMSAVDHTTHLPERERTRSDSLPPWMQYDMSPSVFSQPQASSSSQQLITPDPEPIDAHTQTSTDYSHNADWGPFPYGAVPVTSAKTHPNPPVNTQSSVFTSSPPNLAKLSVVTGVPRLNSQNQASRISPIRQDLHSPDHTSFVSASSSQNGQSVDTISQVLDTIQMRQADWPLGQGTNGPFPAPYSNDWDMNVMSELRDALPQPVAMFNSELLNGPVSAGLRQEALHMWQSVPEALEYVQLFLLTFQLLTVN